MRLFPALGGESEYSQKNAGKREKLLYIHDFWHKLALTLCHLCRDRKVVFTFKGTWKLGLTRHRVIYVWCGVGKGLGGSA